MRVLFIGGTGNISLDCTLEAQKSGIEVYHLNRGTNRSRVPDGVRTITADIRQPAEVEKALGDLTFDTVVDWVVYEPAHIETDIRLFSQRTAQYIFISSASAYKKPVTHQVMNEGTVLHNPYWEYSRKKAACEEFLVNSYREHAFPMTIVRPSHTYGVGWFPTPFGGRDFTVPARMLAGKPVIVHGDGQSLWTLTHTRDFAVGFNGLLGNPAAVGEIFHITSDEALSWDEIHRTIGRALGVVPKIVHIPSDFIAIHDPARGAEILGDKAYTVIFDNSKIRRFVPAFHPTVTFSLGMRWSAEWYAGHKSEVIVDPDSDRRIEKILDVWQKV
ncbi:MAG TPA: SDR family oxidoreductase [Spirochaetia bacterium]|nr:SDR family oxidoreductase [Spirochaetia bacterium]